MDLTARPRRHSMPSRHRHESRDTNNRGTDNSLGLGESNNHNRIEEDDDSQDKGDDDSLDKELENDDSPGEGNNSYNTSAAYSVPDTVASLKRDLLDIDQHFDEISRSVSRLVDIQKQRAGPISSLFITCPAHKCLDTWEGIRKRFKRQVWKSREVATAVAGRAREFRTDLIELLSNTSVSLEDKKEELSGFIKDMAKTQKSAQETTDAFKSIPLEINGFLETFTLMTNKDQKGINDGIKELNEQIGSLKLRIKRYRDEYFQAWGAMYAEISTEDNEAIPIGYNARMAMEALVGSGPREPLIPRVLRGVKTKTKMIKARTKMSHADKQLQQKEAKLETMKADAGDLEEWIEGYVAITEARTNATCHKLEAIAMVWAAVRTDAQTLHESMQSTLRPRDEKRFLELVLKTRGIVPLYEKLEGILIGYANAIV